MLLFSCSENKFSDKKYYEANTNIEMHLTSEDTISVISIVNQFMDFYVEGKYTDAVALLYSQRTPKAEPQLLDNDELKSKLTGWLLICLLSYLQKNKQNGTESGTT